MLEVCVANDDCVTVDGKHLITLQPYERQPIRTDLEDVTKHGEFSGVPCCRCCCTFTYYMRFNSTKDDDAQKTIDVKKSRSTMENAIHYNVTRSLYI